MANFRPLKLPTRRNNSLYHIVSELLDGDSDIENDPIDVLVKLKERRILELKHVMVEIGLLELRPVNTYQGEKKYFLTKSRKPRLNRDGQMRSRTELGKLTFLFLQMLQGSPNGIVTKEQVHAVMHKCNIRVRNFSDCVNICKAAGVIDTGTLKKNGNKIDAYKLLLTE